MNQNLEDNLGYCFNKDILICKKCNQFICIKDLYFNNNQIYIHFFCLNEKRILNYPLKLFIQNYSISYQSNSNRVIPLSKQNEPIGFDKLAVCQCNGEKTKYCIECKMGICDLCSYLHKFHKLFYYQNNIFLNKKQFHKIEKYCYQAYKSLEQFNASIKEILLSQQFKISTKKTDLIYDYINSNNKYNEILFTLFKLLLNSFKLRPNYVNYLNLAFFSQFNQPLKLSRNTKSIYSHKFLQYLIHYFKSNLLISIHSTEKFFSFQKELNLYITQPPCVLERDGYQREDKDFIPDNLLLKVKKGEILTFFELQNCRPTVHKLDLNEKDFLKKHKNYVELSLRIKKLFILRDS